MEQHLHEQILSRLDSFDSRMSQMEGNVSEIKTSVAYMSGKLTSLIGGNGRPSEFDEIKAKVEGHTKALSVIRGIGIAIGSLITVAASVLFEVFRHSH